MKIFWFIPTHGDSRYLAPAWAHAPSLDYFKQVAIAADTLGTKGAVPRPFLRRLVGGGREPQDATTRLKFLVALRPGLCSLRNRRMAAPSTALRRGASRQPGDGRRRGELEGDGLFLPHAERYVQSPSSSPSGASCSARATTPMASTSRQAPEREGRQVLYPGQTAASAGVLRRLFGRSARTRGAAARHLPHLGEPPAAWPAEVADIRRAPLSTAARWSSDRLHVIVRETEDEAWRAAGKLVSPWMNRWWRPRREIRRDGFGGPEQHGRSAQGPMSTRQTSRRLRVFANLWAGVGWCAVAPARRSWATRSRWPTASRSTPTWAARVLHLLGYRTWKRLTVLPNWCFRCCRLQLRDKLAASTSRGRSARSSPHLRAARCRKAEAAT